MSIQMHREKIAANGGKMLAYDSDFFQSLEKRYAGLKDKSAHPADFRRLSGDIRAYATRLADKSDWNDDRDRPVYEGVMAWNALIDHEIEMRVAASHILDSAAATEGQWVDKKTGKTVKVYAPSEKMAASTADERKSGVTLGGVLAGLLGGRRTPEISAALEGESTPGGWTVPGYLSVEFIDRLRAASTVVRAGAQNFKLPSGGDIEMVRVVSDPLVVWRGENDDIGDSDPNFDHLVFKAKSLSTLVKCSYELLNDSLNIEDILTTTLVNAMAGELDRAGLLGSGVGYEPRGLNNTVGINSVSMGTNGSQPGNYDNLLDAIYEMELDNTPSASAMIWHPRTARTYRKLKDTTNQPLVAPAPVLSLPNPS